MNNKPKLATLEECTGCLACVDSCKKNAIKVDYGHDGFQNVIVDTNICNNCGICEKICPITNPISIKESNTTTWAAWSNNEELRQKSASGGAFSEIATSFLQDGGIVIGAAIFGKEVKHIAIEKEEDLYLLQGSKYLQSNTKGIFSQTYKYLKNDQNVLFSGLPCQIAAIISYLKNKKYLGSIYTIDLICHGVPTQSIISLYEEHIGKTIKTINSFRDKSSNSHFCMNVNFEDNSTTSSTFADKDFFLTAYGKNLLSRNSCYNCNFATINRLSDLSIADYWGDNDYKDQHKKGLSLVLCHNEKGNSILKNSNLTIKKGNWIKALHGNPRIFNGKSFIQYHPVRRKLIKYLNLSSKQKQQDAFCNNLSLANLYNYVFWILLRIADKIFDSIKLKRTIKLSNKEI